MKKRDLSDFTSSEKKAISQRTQIKLLADKSRLTRIRTRDRDPEELRLLLLSARQRAKKFKEEVIITKNGRLWKFNI